jgi:hypothetical protein
MASRAVRIPNTELTPRRIMPIRNVEPVMGMPVKIHASFTMLPIIPFPLSRLVFSFIRKGCTAETKSHSDCYLQQIWYVHDSFSSLDRVTHYWRDIKTAVIKTTRPILPRPYRSDVSDESASSNLRREPETIPSSARASAGGFSRSRRRRLAGGVCGSFFRAAWFCPYTGPQISCKRLRGGKYGQFKGSNLKISFVSRPVKIIVSY